MSKNEYLILTKKFNGEAHALCRVPRNAMAVSDCYALKPLNHTNFGAMIKSQVPQPLDDLRRKISDLVDKDVGYEFKGPAKMADFKDLEISRLVISMHVEPF